MGLTLKVTTVHTLISKGDFSVSHKWAKIREKALEAVRGAEWPPGSGSFTIYPESGKKRCEGNRSQRLTGGWDGELHWDSIHE